MRPQAVARVALRLLLVLAALVATLLLLIIVTSRPPYTTPAEPWDWAGDFTSNFTWDGKRPLRIAMLTWFEEETKEEEKERKLKKEK